MKFTQTHVSRFVAAAHALILATLVGVPWQTAPAAPVTSKQAAAAVAGWLNLDRTPLGEPLGTTVQRVDTFGDNAGNAQYYVVYLDPSGFVIVAADDLVEPIVGFARAGKFDPSTSNPLGALVSNDLSARVAYARQLNAVSPGPSALQAQAKWQQLGVQDSGPAPQGPTPQLLASVSEIRIAPLTQTTWDQQTAGGQNTPACYNYYTPPGPDGNAANYPAGCVATAMAQLMRYYQFPAAGVGSAAFWITNNGAPAMYNLHGGDTFGGPYSWANMPLVPPYTPTLAQCQAIGALVADAGATVHMQYASGGSSSYLTDAKTALVSTFQFSSAIKGYNNSYDIGAGLRGMINPNLDARYPVLLGIKGTGGHAVVADGYGYSASTLYHHLNLGWSGMESAWYELPTIDADSNHNYSVVDTCIYNAYTNGTGEIISGRVTDQIGRPVVNATVTASGGGGPYTSTTDTNGIYALARIPSGSSYSITVTKANYNMVSGNYSTDTSSDMAATSGNYWGADFTMPMLATVLDHLVWGAVAPTQYLNTPFPVTITAQNLTNGPATGFAGPVALSGYTTGLVSASSTIIGSLPWSNARSSPSGVTHGYAFTPNTNIQVTAIRSYSDSGNKVCIWTDSGTLLATNQTVSSSRGWAEATLATPIVLSAGTTYRVTGYYGPNVWGYYYTNNWPTTFANGSVGQNFYTAFGDTFPVQVFATNQGPLVDLRYQVVFSNSIPVSPTSSGAFVNGVWSGNVTVGQVATNVVLKADDGAGHTALSSPFKVIDPNAAPPIITTQPQSRTNNAGDNALFSVVATSGPTPGYYWRRNGSFISGATASSYTLNNVQLLDSGSQFSCVVSNSYGAVTSQTATLTVICTNVVVAAQPNVTLNSGGAVYAVVPLPDGAIVFGGHFTNVNGVVRSNIARLLPSGTLDAAWNPGANASIFTLAANGTILYAGGSFTNIGGAGRTYIAKLSGIGSGTVDSTWNPSADWYVDTLLLNGSDLYAGGEFGYIGGQYCSCLAKLSTSGSGGADANWNPYATMTADYPAVYAIAISGTSLYAGGYFTAIGGQTRTHLAKLSTAGTGAADPTWAPNPSTFAYSLALSGADVYVSGAFTNVGGRNRNYIAKLSSLGTGAADLTWNPNTGYGTNYGVWSLAVRGLCLYAGGSFTSIGGLNRSNVAKLSTLGTGAADAAWDANCNGVVNFLLPGTNALYVGGSFTQVAGQTRPGLAALTYTPLQLLSPQRPGGGQFQCTLSGERGQAFEMLASTNLQNWDTVATLTNSTGTTNFTDLATGFKRRFYRAHQVL